MDETEFRFLPEGIKKPFKTERDVQDWLNNERERNYMLTPFRSFKNCITKYTGQENPDYASVRKFEIKGKKVSLMGLNSALMCRRNRIKADDEQIINDDRFLIVGEPQIYNGLEQIGENDDLKIVVLHHPLDWLIEFDRNYTESRLVNNFHFILHGHRHYPQIKTRNSSEGDCVIISCGASYDRRIVTDSRYANAYNFVNLNLETGSGKVYLRCWSNRRIGGSWIEDVETYKNGEYSFILPKQLK